MKIKYLKYSLSALAALTIGFTGCSNDTVQSVIDDNTGNPSDSAQYTAGTIQYEDGTDFGVTRKKALNNGGFQVYSIGTGEVIGFIQVDGSVNDIGGNNLGTCQNATITDLGLQRECQVAGLKPTSPQVDDGDNNTPNTPNIDASGYPTIPKYAAGVNSTGMIEVNCQDDIIYYTLSYVCFIPTVKLSTKTNSGTLTEDKDAKQGANPFTYYEYGHIDRDGKADAVKVTGTITGGNGGGPYTARCGKVN